MPAGAPVALKQGEEEVHRAVRVVGEHVDAQVALRCRYVGQYADPWR